MSDEPVNPPTVLAGLDRLWSPRIVGRVNDYDVRVARVAGEHVWHVHENTDEFFLVLAGEFTIDPRDGDRGERRVVLGRGRSPSSHAAWSTGPPRPTGPRS